MAMIDTEARDVLDRAYEIQAAVRLRYPAWDRRLAHPFGVSGDAPAHEWRVSPDVMQALYDAMPLPYPVPNPKSRGGRLPTLTLSEVGAARPRLLDLFCGAGGAAVGYHRAGFDVVGVDIAPQPHYPFEFHQADALTWPLDGFDAIHASPPCQAYSAATRDYSNHADLYDLTRRRLHGAGLPFAIENVIGAPYDHGVFLCGSMFGLAVDGEWVQRHRNFETSWFAFQPQCQHPTDRRALLVTGHAFIKEARDCGRHSRQGPFELAERLMGIDWMSRHELTQAIPPAYTEWIGAQLLRALAVAA
jgi:DNA (cytosine-5)-methyltransferase 1